jgi:hypothetical protein
MLILFILSNGPGDANRSTFFIQENSKEEVH